MVCRQDFRAFVALGISNLYVSTLFTLKIKIAIRVSSEINDLGRF